LSFCAAVAEQASARLQTKIRNVLIVFSLRTLRLFASAIYSTVNGICPAEYSHKLLFLDLERSRGSHLFNVTASFSGCLFAT
jgi:hypothetical protein